MEAVSAEVFVERAFLKSGELMDLGFRVSDHRPFEYVEVSGEPIWACPSELSRRIEVDTVHDGACIPSVVASAPEVARLIEEGAFWRKFARERDWGANLVAEHLSRALGIGGYHRVNVARAVMDFNRFPGSTPPDASHFDRLAINEPLNELLNYREKSFVLEECYDPISAGMEEAISGKVLKLAIHTYDELNATKTQRPEVSLLTRSDSYQRYSRLPYGLFDPMFPDILVESTVDPVLRDRLALTLQKGGLNVEHNYPYCQPDGSIEVRSQPWLFFSQVRHLYEQRHPQRASDPAHILVWDMLLNTNLRGAEAESLSGYLHRFRQAPGGREEEFQNAQVAYEEIRRFRYQEPRLVDDYRQSSLRGSALAIEVRKDLLFRFEDGEPVEPLEENARRIAEKVAEGIAIYLSEDCNFCL